MNVVQDALTYFAVEEIIKNKSNKQTITQKIKKKKIH